MTTQKIEAACTRVDEISAELSLCINMQQVGPEEWDYASAIDARTGQMVSELTGATGVIRAALAASSVARSAPADERAEFEAWAVREDGGNWDADDELFTRGIGDQYNHVGIRNEWNVWKARAAIAASQQAAPKAALTDGEIADVYRDTFNYSDDMHMQSSQLRFARAILAAASPNAALVEALTEMVSWFGRYPEFVPVPEAYDNTKASIAKSRAALASLPPTQEAQK
jgi:hypothetical protein